MKSLVPVITLGALAVAVVTPDVALTCSPLACRQEGGHVEVAEYAASPTNAVRIVWLVTS